MFIVNGIRLFISFVLALKDLVVLAFIIFKFVRDEYGRYQRGHVVNEIKEAIKESIKTGDNTRLDNVLAPQSDPFPREDPKGENR